ncbi:MAG: ATP-binding cassette domain-containing protein [Acidobacteriota bacterium]
MTPGAIVARPMARSLLLELDNITIYRGDRVALDRLALSVREGEHIAILGPNGCGKSTLIKAMARELYPYRGNGPFVFRVMGRDVWDVSDLRAMVGIVTADLIAMCTRALPAREVILSGFFSSIGVWAHHTVTPEMEQRTDEVMDLLEVQHLGDRLLDELSSGEARRVVIGRALVHRPRALLLDEPTNSLDMRSTHELREIGRKIAQSGTTIILVTHHLPDIIPEIDRVVVLQNGTIRADGPKTEMLTQQTLSTLFGIQLDVIVRDGYYQVV